jgi:hypothetical protein
MIDERIKQRSEKSRLNDPGNILDQHKKENCGNREFKLLYDLGKSHVEV